MIAACAALSLTLFASACGASGDETAQLPGPTSEPTSVPTEPALSPDPTEASQTPPPTAETPATEGATTEPTEPPASTTEPDSPHPEDPLDTDPDPEPTEPPAEFECQPVTVHGELHEQTPADSDGDGVFDTCEAPHGHPHETATEEPTVEPTAEPTSGAVEPTPRPTPKPTVDTTPEPTADPTPVAIVCNPETVHGEAHEMVPTDTDGDGVADECRPPHEHPHEELAPEEVHVPEPIAVDDYSTVCADPAPHAETGLGTGSDGAPCAVRLLTRSELIATGLFNVGRRGSADGGIGGFLQQADYSPNVPEAEALAHVTSCVRAEPPNGYRGAGGWARMPDEATTFQACNVLWLMAAGPVNHAGMRPEARCVYDTFIAFHLRGDYSLDHTSGDWHRYGWGEVCDSWIDPEPDQTFIEKCHWLYGHYVGHQEAAGRIGAYDQCREYNKEATHEWFAPRGPICGHRYRLVRMALLFMHREARDLGLLPDNGEIVDYMYPRPADGTGAYRVC